MQKPLLFISLLFISLTPTPCVNGQTNNDFANDSGYSASQNADRLTTDPADGPLLNERRAFIQKLRQAKQQGIGIAPYLSEYGRIQDSLSSDNSQAQSSRLQSLKDSLDSQIKRSNYFKTQRPSQMAPSKSGTDSIPAPPPPAGAAGGLGAGAGGLPLPIEPSASDGQLLNKIKERLGGKLPSNWQDKINSPEGQMILKKLQGGQ